MKSKEQMTEYIKKRPLVMSTDGDLKQQKINEYCDFFKKTASKYEAAKELLSMDSATFWIDYRPGTTAGKGLYESVLNGETKIVKDALPANLTGINKLIGNTYTFKDQIKTAGFKWDSNAKAWVNPSISKTAATLLDDEPSIDYITEIS